MAASYMYQVSYTDQARSELVKSPVDRIEAIRPAVRKLGGKIETGYFTFGDYDLVVIVSMPDNVSATALSLAASAGGSIKSIKTTPLMTIREGMRAMRQAKKTGYTPPGA